MQHLSAALARVVRQLGGPTGAGKAWRVDRGTVLRWLKGSHPPSLPALQRVLVTIPATDRYALFMAIEADAWADEEVK